MKLTINKQSIICPCSPQTAAPRGPHRYREERLREPQDDERAAPGEVPRHHHHLLRPEQREPDPGVATCFRGVCVGGGEGGTDCRHAA